MPFVLSLCWVVHVSCGDRGTAFHSEPLCLRLDGSIIDVLLQDGSALSYRCCRCNPGGTNNSRDGGDG